MSDVWTVGPLIIKHSWVWLGIIVVISVFMMKQFFSETLGEEKNEKESFWNAFFAFFLTFQFSKLILQFQVAIKDPIAILATPSGANEWMLAWFVMSIYLWWVTRANANLRVTLFLKVTVSYLIVETMYYALFPFTTIPGVVRTSVLLMVINAFLLVWVYLQVNRNIAIQKILGQVLALFGLINGVLALFISIRMLDYSVPSWFYILVFLAGLITISSYDKTKGEK
ncbi:hypothetical protein [Bacillus sp. FJAT-45037]|uniref:hypothetical protein n=1 Tax=Bacillus sp. FJAT-45037 TaxID=2011007 RepID=UPI000C243F36|nr:hypothetical protein [Bacillus sp. FJAT-45037]